MPRHISKPTTYNNETYSPGAPPSIRDQATPGSQGTSYDTLDLALPVYICPTGVGATPPTDAQSQRSIRQSREAAQIRYDLEILIPTPDDFAGLSNCRRRRRNIRQRLDIFPRRHLRRKRPPGDSSGRHLYSTLLNLVADGGYNFVNPSQNTQATRSYLSPTNVQDSYSREAEGRGQSVESAADLPGGPLQLGIGASFRYEAVNDPSANDDTNGPDRTLVYDQPVRRHRLTNRGGRLLRVRRPGSEQTRSRRRRPFRPLFVRTVAFFPRNSRRSSSRST